MKFAFRRYFSSISTENDSSSSFFRNVGFKVYIRVITKRIRTNKVKKNTFFHFSVKELVNFSENSNDTGPTEVP